MKTIIPVVIIFSVLLLIPLGYQSVFAGQSIGGVFGPDNPPISPEPVFPSDPGDYFFGNRITFDPNAPQQEKHFLNVVLGANQIFEQIINDGRIPITDWHEELLDHPFVIWFGTTQIVDCSTGVILPNAVINTASNDRAIWIDFNPPIQQGQCFEIQKTFEVRDLSALPMDSTGAPFVRVLEFPTAQQLDWGDLDEPTYPTLAASMGPSHIITGLKMGTFVDAEPDGQPNPAATRDDAVGVDDEDGLSSTTLVAGSASSTVTIISTNGPGTIHVFADKGAGLVPVGMSAVGIGGPHVVPADMTGASAGPIELRIRFCDTADCSTIGGASASGEVEDYIDTVASVPVCPPGTTGIPPNCVAVPPNPVGGTGIPISTTSLLLAGLDSNYSILMALAVIGFGAFGALYYTTKKKSE